MNPRHLFLVVSILVVGLVCTQEIVFAQCEGAGPSFPNVSWSIEDSVAAWFLESLFLPLVRDPSAFAGV